MSYFRLDLVPCEQQGVIMDIGMNRGQFALEAIEKFNPRSFTGVEMLGDLVEQARKHPVLGRHKILHLAISDQGHRALWARRVPKMPDASSILEINPEAGRWWNMDLGQFGGEWVQAETLDGLCAWLPVCEIDLLKIDVQGYEAHVLRGGVEILQKTKAVIIEVLFAPVYDGQADPFVIGELLKQAGLRFDRWLRYDAPLEGDALYVRA